jgi:hypothetical protein
MSGGDGRGKKRFYFGEWMDQEVSMETYELAKRNHVVVYGLQNRRISVEHCYGRCVQSISSRRSNSAWPSTALPHHHGPAMLIASWRPLHITFQFILLITRLT